MKQKKRAPQRVVTLGAQESICTISRSGAFTSYSRPERRQRTRAWRVETSYRKRRNEYAVSVVNGITFVAFFGKVSDSNPINAQTEAELRGILVAIDWIKHESKETTCEVVFSEPAFAVFMGELICPGSLSYLLEKARRNYIASVDSITIDRTRRSLVTRAERLAA